MYCGSSKGRLPVYEETARDLADFFIENKIRLVNGGGSIGLMGVMGDRMMERGGEAIGVIPMSLREKEVAHLGMTELIVTPDMHSRKLTMVNLSDAFIAIPGGFGTLDELFETLTWSQLHIHHKPIGILNVDGYFDHLVKQLELFVQEGFLSTKAMDLLNIAASPQELLNKFESHHGYSETKWD